MGLFELKFFDQRLRLRFLVVTLVVVCVDRSLVSLRATPVDEEDFQRRFFLSLPSDGNVPYTKGVIFPGFV